MRQPVTRTPRRHTTDTLRGPERPRPPHPREPARAAAAGAEAAAGARALGPAAGDPQALRSLRAHRDGPSTDAGMCHELTTAAMPAAAPAPPVTPLLVDTRGLAGLLGVGYDTLKDACALERWRQRELPAPIWIGRNSHRHDARSGVRRWRLAEVEAFLGLRARVEVAAPPAPTCLGCAHALGVPRLLAMRELAVVLALGYDTLRRYASGPEPAWVIDDLPTPIRVGAGAALDGGQRRWDLAAVHAWLAERQRRAHQLYGLVHLGEEVAA